MGVAGRHAKHLINAYSYNCLSSKGGDFRYHNKTVKYMLRIAGQTAGPIGLIFFVDTHGWLGGVKGYEK